MEVFAQFGYRRASMDQVAEAAGLTRQAVYHHFGSKEALFHAAVEALHDGAYEAAAAAGAATEQAGKPLADVLASQIDAKFRYIIECLEETAHVEELLSERQHQTRDLNQRFHEQAVALQVATIERCCQREQLALRDGMTAADLARSIQFAIRGYNDLRLDITALGELTAVIKLIVQGATMPLERRARSISRSRPRHRQPSGKPARSSRHLRSSP